MRACLLASLVIFLLGVATFAWAESQLASSAVAETSADITVTRVKRDLLRDLLDDVDPRQKAKLRRKHAAAASARKRQALQQKNHRIAKLRQARIAKQRRIQARALKAQSAHKARVLRARRANEARSLKARIAHRALVNTQKRAARRAALLRKKKANQKKQKKNRARGAKRS